MLPDWVAIYFLKQNDLEHKCNLCDCVIQGDSKSINLLQHIVNIHKEIFELHKDQQDSPVGFQIEFVQFSMLKEDENKSEPFIVEEVCETEVVDTEKVVDKPKKEVLNMEYLILPKNKKIKKSHAEFSRRRSWVWKYFDNLTNIIYRCKLCNVVLSIKGCNTNNMNRHVRTRHPGIYKSEVAKKELEAETDVKYVPDEEQEEVPVLSEDLVDFAKQRRSWIWSYFKRISNTCAQCKLCNRNISHGGNATGNMNRHLKMIHNKTADEPTNAHEWIIWLYFKQVSKIIAQCNICGHNVGYVDNATRYLDEHLNEAHNIVPDYKNWIWKVFENIDDDRISCKICSYKCTKFIEVEKTVECILNHLKNDHDVISGSQIITGALFEVPTE